MQIFVEIRFMYHGDPKSLGIKTRVLLARVNDILLEHFENIKIFTRGKNYDFNLPVRYLIKFGSGQFKSKKLQIRKH